MKPRNPIEKRDARTATTTTDSPNGSGDQHLQAYSSSGLRVI